MQPLLVCKNCKKVKVKFGEMNNVSLCEECYYKASNTVSSRNYDFITIDFEIANNKMNSACSLGIVFVKDQQIVDEKYYLIQPPTLEFEAATMKIHGLTADDVRNEKKFNEIWIDIKDYFNSSTVIAHNAQFDMSVLHSCLTEYSLEYPDFLYIDSITLSTKACRGQGVGRTLPERLAFFNIQLDNHHNAAADARAVAELVIACMKSKNRRTLSTYITMFGAGIPVREFSALKPQTEFKKKSKFKHANIAISEISVTVETISTNHPLFGKTVVFTGELISLDRKDAMQMVVNAGGFVRTNISSKTNILIVGIQDKTLVGVAGISTKEKKAHELIEKGVDIKIIKESEFIKLIDSEKQHLEELL